MISELQAKFKFLSTDPHILGIIFYGSFATKQNHAKSDIDICIVAGKSSKYPLYKKIMAGFPEDISNYDIRFFEELPLLIRGKIIEEGVVLYTPDMGKLTEYFFFSTRKELEEYRFRISHLNY